jgi:hypothetical protein
MSGDLAGSCLAGCDTSVQRRDAAQILVMVRLAQWDLRRIGRETLLRPAQPSLGRAGPQSCGSVALPATASGPSPG